MLPSTLSPFRNISCQLEPFTAPICCQRSGLCRSRMRACYLSLGGAYDREYNADEHGPPIRTDRFGTGSSASVAGSSGVVGFGIAGDPNTIVDYMHRPGKEAALRTLRNAQAHPVLRPKMRKAKES